MKKETIKHFNLKRKKHPHFGMGYLYRFNTSGWIKDGTALLYSLISLERWAKNMQEVLKKEETL